MSDAYKCDVCGELFDGSGSIRSPKVLTVPSNKASKGHTSKEIAIYVCHYVATNGQFIDYDETSDFAQEGKKTQDICLTCQIFLIEKYLNKLKLEEK